MTETVKEKKNVLDASSTIATLLQKKKFFIECQRCFLLKAKARFRFFLSEEPFGNKEFSLALAVCQKAQKLNTFLLKEIFTQLVK